MTTIPRHMILRRRPHHVQRDRARRYDAVMVPVVPMRDPYPGGTFWVREQRDLPGMRDAIGGDVR